MTNIWFPEITPGDAYTGELSEAGLLSLVTFNGRDLGQVWGIKFGVPRIGAEGHVPAVAWLHHPSFQFLDSTAPEERFFAHTNVVALDLLGRLQIKANSPPRFLQRGEQAPSGALVVFGKATCLSTRLLLDRDDSRLCYVNLADGIEAYDAPSEQRSGWITDWEIHYARSPDVSPSLLFRSRESSD